MSTIGIFIGPEMSELQHSTEDPSTILRLSALAASWAASNGHTVLALGDAPALLAVGTAVVGLQQGRVLEGGERQRSPIRALSLLASDNADRDRSLSFQRRGREATSGISGVDPPEEEQTFGDLCLLVDLGIMDIAGDSQLSLQPQLPETAAKHLSGQLLSEAPRAILAIGQMSEVISQAAREYTRQTKSRFACLLSEIDGAERLIGGVEQIPMLNNRRLRFRDHPPSIEDTNDDAYDTTDEALMRAANQATWEAELTFQMYQWLTLIAE